MNKKYFFRQKWCNNIDVIKNITNVLYIQY